jgi:hypothetical protein
MMHFYRCFIGKAVVWMTMEAKVRFMKEHDDVPLVLRMFCGSGMMEGAATFEPTSAWWRSPKDESVVRGNIFM